MPKALYTQKAIVAPGEVERHFGHDFVAQEDGSLLGDIADDLIDSEVACGRVVLASGDEGKKKKADK